MAGRGGIEQLGDVQVGVWYQLNWDDNDQDTGAAKAVRADILFRTILVHRVSWLERMKVLVNLVGVKAEFYRRKPFLKSWIGRTPRACFRFLWIYQTRKASPRLDACLLS